MSTVWSDRLRSKRGRTEEEGGAWAARLRPRSRSPPPSPKRARRSSGARPASPARRPSKRARQGGERQAAAAEASRNGARRSAERREARREAAVERRGEARREAATAENRKGAARKTGAARKAALRVLEAESKAKAEAEAEREAKAESEAKHAAEERRADVRARVAALLHRFGAREAFRVLWGRVQQTLAAHGGGRVRARARRAFGALVRRRKAAIARAQRLLRRLGARHKWRQGAMAQLRQRRVERRVRRALRRLSRFVRSARGRTACITVQPFAFMRDRRAPGLVTVLRQGYRGHAFTLDSQGHYHQQLKEISLTVPLAATFGLQEYEVLWCVGSGLPVDARPAFDESLPIYSYVKDALRVFDSCLTAVRFRDVIEVNLDAAYDALAVVNHDSARAAFAYSKYASVDTRSGAGTLDAWLQRPAAAGVRLANACAYDLLLQLYKAPIQALQRPDPSRNDHRGGRYKELDMSYQGLWLFFRLMPW